MIVLVINLLLTSCYVNINLAVLPKFVSKMKLVKDGIYLGTHQNIHTKFQTTIHNNSSIDFIDPNNINKK